MGKKNLSDYKVSWEGEIPEILTRLAKKYDIPVEDLGPIEIIMGQLHFLRKVEGKQQEVLDLMVKKIELQDKRIDLIDLSIELNEKMVKVIIDTMKLLCVVGFLMWIVAMVF